MIDIKNLCISYGNLSVYENFNLQIEQGKITAILGESGSGKTTLLNAIAGLIEYKGEILGDYKQTSFVFQKEYLVPNLTVKENLQLVTKGVDFDKELETFGVLDKKDEYPKNLSGGMARRVSILRGLIFPAKTLLLDEPFINLDLALKYHLINIIKERQKESKQTTILVTHDIKEATLLADRIIVVKKGEIIFDTENKGDQTEKELFNIMINIGK
jgi:NitT/TauT family transport system ATP-binding protein